MTFPSLGPRSHQANGSSKAPLSLDSIYEIFAVEQRRVSFRCNERELHTRCTVYFSNGERGKGCRERERGCKREDRGRDGSTGSRLNNGEAKPRNFGQCYLSQSFVPWLRLVQTHFHNCAPRVYLSAFYSAFCDRGRTSRARFSGPPSRRVKTFLITLNFVTAVYYARYRGRNFRGKS